MSKELPESKPEPEKSCGNCVHDGMDCSKRNIVCAGWQPKATEPQNNDVSKKDKLTHIDTEAQKAEAWEQRFNGKFSADFYAMATKHMDNVRAFIRAEIERAREEEKQSIL